MSDGDSRGLTPGQPLEERVDGGLAGGQRSLGIVGPGDHQRRLVDRGQDHVSEEVDLALGEAAVLRDPPQVSRLMAFTDHGMDLELRFWISDPQEGVNNIRSEVNRRIWRLFKEHHLTMPVAQHAIRILGGSEDAKDLSKRLSPEE